MAVREHNYKKDLNEMRGGNDMKGWKKYTHLLLALVLCLILTACGGSNDSGGKVENDEDTPPATISNLATDTSVEYDYSALMGTWTGEDDGIAHICWMNEDDTLYIDSFGTFTKVSGDVPGETIGDDVTDASMTIHDPDFDGNVLV